jgi:streptomycin 6-kinase
VTARELTGLLGRNVLAIERTPFAYASSHPLELLDVCLNDGTAMRLVLKDTGTLVPAARDAKPLFLRDPDREREVYRAVLRESTAAPRLVASLDNLLLLEHVRGAPLTELGDFRIWEEAARATGRLHRALRGRESPHLIRYDRAFFARWLDRARIYSDGQIDGLVEPYRSAAEALLAGPQTVIHGELYASNVLVAGERICVLDWETAGVGPGLLDLAALTSGAWTAAERESLAAAYAAGLGDRAGSPDLLLDLERSRLVLAVQWLGWSRTWSPPVTQRQNWLAEARRAAKVLA